VFSNLILFIENLGIRASHPSIILSFGEPQGSGGLRFSKSNVTFLNPNVLFLNSNVAFLKPNVAFLNSNVAFLSLNVAFLSPNVAFLNLNVAFLSPNVAVLNPSRTSGFGIRDTRELRVRVFTICRKSRS